MRYDEENEENDYFDKEYTPEPPKEPAPPKYKPDDARYWEEPESEWEHLRPARSKRIWIWLIAAVCVVFVCIAFYMRYFQPYVTDGVQYGYVERIEKRGSLFKTFEGVLLPYREIMDTTRLYRRDFVFTAANPTVAAEIKRMEKLHKPVRMEYIRYNATVPWRGDSKIIITKVEAADARNLLPPEFQPEVIPQGLQPSTPQQ